MEQSEFQNFWQEPDPSPTAVRLADAIATRLAAVVPEAFRVRSKGGSVSFYHGDEWRGTMSAAIEESEDQGSIGERAAMVAWNALSHAQDLVAKVTTEPWPRLRTGGMAVPGTRAAGRTIHLWYGSHSEGEAGAVLSLPPILLDDVVGAE